jgi:hypothetical protein
MEPDNTNPTQTVEPREPWEKKSDESPRAYAAFVQYRDAEKRSLKDIAASFNCSTQNIHAWSVRHNWKLRCDAFDTMLCREQIVEFQRRRTKMRDRHLLLASSMLHIAAIGLRELQAKNELHLPLHMTPEQIALLTRAATEIEHRILDEGEARGVTEIRVMLSSLSDETFDEMFKPGTKRPSPDAPMPVEEFERLQWEQLTPEEREAELQYKNPPPPRLTN